jgi:hypothetical protein
MVGDALPGLAGFGFDGLNVSVLGQPKVRLVGRPPIWTDSWNGDVFRQRDDQVRLADRPLIVVRKDPSRWRILWIPFEGPAIDPCGDRADLRVRKAAIVFEVLNTDALLDVPRRHLAPRDTVLDRTGPGSGVLEIDQRNGSDRTRTMTLLAGPLKNRFDILVKCDVRTLWRLRGDMRQSRGCGDRSDARNRNGVSPTNARCCCSLHVVASTRSDFSDPPAIDPSSSSAEAVACARPCSLDR